MFIGDVKKKEEIRNIAIQDLRKLGIKYRPKRPGATLRIPKCGKKFFKIPLQNLETQTVTLKDGQQLVVSKRVHEICSFILSKADTEGIFRKEGSKSRQNEIKLSLDRGCLLGDEHHVIDVAVVLKCFLRELPEPLIPYSHHELFLRCILVEEKIKAILLACLFLPMEHLSHLAYLMQFFKEVASYSGYNRMGISNLAIVLGPNLFPIEEKLPTKSQLISTKTCDIVKLMIEYSNQIGIIPEDIIEQALLGTENVDDKRRKKRRSGSLTRMFNGLKKMVGSKVDDEVPSNQTIPDLLQTPSIQRKRKSDNGLSMKKRKDLLNQLPQGTLLNTPFTPCRTPVSVDPSGKKILTFEVDDKAIKDSQKEKKLHWYMRSRSMKNLKEETEQTSRRNSLGPKALIERRWSAVSQAANFRRKKRNSCTAVQIKKAMQDRTKEKSPEQEPDYVRVSKTEYEAIKNRVSEIERRISMELDTHTVDNQKPQNADDNQSNIKNVQTAYEQTLVQAAPLSPTTDHLAKRLSRDLRIRRNSEQKMIRSPSARKIGSMRRRSREMERKSVNLNRHQTWHVGSTQTNAGNPRMSLRNRSNTPQHTAESSTAINVLATSQHSQNTSQASNKSSRLAHQQNANSLSKLSCSGSSSEHWVSAEGFFDTVNTPQSSCGSNRASIAKLRSQNAGMVLAKAKLFDNVRDCESACSQNSQTESTEVMQVDNSVKNVHKIGAVRKCETRSANRVRALKAEERKTKKSMSPRRRTNVAITQKQRMQIARQYARGGKENSLESSDNSLASPAKINHDSLKVTPKNVPHIKKSLAVKSPKRLCRTPVSVSRNTPLKVLSTPHIGV